LAIGRRIDMHDEVAVRQVNMRKGWVQQLAVMASI